MEGFKQELFFEEYKSTIEFEPATAEELIKLEKKLINRLGESVDEKSFFIELKETLTHSNSFELIDHQEGFEKALTDLLLIDQSEVFVIWRYKHDVDKFTLPYLIKYWENIWFPPSDDAVCLFFPNINKAIIITHYNVIYY